MLKAIKVDRNLMIVKKLNCFQYGIV